MKSQKFWHLVKALVPVLTLSEILSVGCLSAAAQTSSNTTEIEKLKSVVDQQQKTLEQQQSQIQALQAALAEQKKIVLSVMRAATSSDARSQLGWDKRVRQGLCVRLGRKCHLQRRA